MSDISRGPSPYQNSAFNTCVEFKVAGEPSQDPAIYFRFAWVHMILKYFPGTAWVQILQSVSSQSAWFLPSV